MPGEKAQKEVNGKKLNWRHIVALILNLFILPGTGTWLLGKAKLGQLQMIGYLISAILILSGGFGITGALLTIISIIGILALITSWGWGAYTVIAEIHKIYY